MWHIMTQLLAARLAESSLNSLNIERTLNLELDRHIRQFFVHVSA